MAPTTASDITIREFADGDEAAFRQLNEEWIIRYFTLEAADLELLNDPRRTILDPGGRIFFAVKDGEAVGCCALVATGVPGDYEVAKMAVTEACRQAGIGRKLLAAVIEGARAAGAHRLHLETNSKLAPAIHLYKSLGFRDIPPDRLVPSPYARAEVFLELFF